MRIIVETIQTGLTMEILNSRARIVPQAPPFLDAAEFLTEMRAVSLASDIPSSDFVNGVYSQEWPIERLVTDLSSPIHSRSAILSLPLRYSVFQQTFTLSHKNASERAVRIAATDPTLSTAELRSRAIFELAVRRDHLLEDTISIIRRVSDDALKQMLRVTFRDEPAIDAGGVQREYFDLLISQIFSGDFGMFRIVNERFHWFTHGFFRENEHQYKTLGTVVALAVSHGIVLPVRFPLAFYKKLLNLPVSLKDMAELDPECAQGLMAMLEMPAKGEDVAACGQSWIAFVDNFGEKEEVELAPGGRERPVTTGDVREFVDAYAKWYLTTSIEKQFELFRSGFRRVLADGSFAKFAPDELDIIVSGEEVFEWGQLEKNAKYKNGYSPESRPVTWFWSIFEALTSEEKRKFLRFTTGTDRAPVGGLANVVITIARLDPGGWLPRGHTCFSLLALPAYHTIDEMRLKLRQAINETEGFGLK
jgi:ubiquitin-protein ligase E3 A